MRSGEFIARKLAGQCALTLAEIEGAIKDSSFKVQGDNRLAREIFASRLRETGKGREEIDEDGETKDDRFHEGP